MHSTAAQACSTTALGWYRAGPSVGGEIVQAWRGSDGRDYEPFIGGLRWQSLAFSVREKLVGAGIALAVSVASRNWLNAQRGFSRFMSDHAYTAYVIRSPAIISLALAASSLQLTALAKFGVATVGAVSACFLVSRYLLRSIPFARGIL